MLPLYIKFLEVQKKQTNKQNKTKKWKDGFDTLLVAVDDDDYYTTIMMMTIMERID